MDIDKTLESIVATANSLSHIRQMIRGWDRRICLKVDGVEFELASGDQDLCVRCGAVESADLTFELDEQTFMQLIAGQTTPLKAKTAGKIKTAGNLTDILKFASVLSKASEAHRAKRGPVKQT